MSGYNPAGDISVLEQMKTLNERVSELEQKVDVLGSVLETIAKVFGYRPKR